MAKYILFLHDNPGTFSNVSPQEMQAIVGRYKGWRQKMSEEGRMLGSNKLMDEGGKHLRRVGDRLEVQDGPYAEAREVLGGYFMLEAKDYDEAVSLAGGCPHLDFGWIEVREVHELPGA